MKQDYQLSQDCLRRAKVTGHRVIIQYRRSASRSQNWRNYLPIIAWDKNGAAEAVQAWLVQGIRIQPRLPRFVMILQKVAVRFL